MRLDCITPPLETLLPGKSAQILQQTPKKRERGVCVCFLSWGRSLPLLFRVPQADRPWSLSACSSLNHRLRWRAASSRSPLDSLLRAKHAFLHVSAHVRPQCVRIAFVSSHACHLKDFFVCCCFVFTLILGRDWEPTTDEEAHSVLERLLKVRKLLSMCRSVTGTWQSLPCPREPQK